MGARITAGRARAARRCCAQLLEALTEVSARLRPAELEVLAPALRRPSLCALLASTPQPGSLHEPSLRLLWMFVQSPALFALAHQVAFERVGREAREA